MRRIECVRDLPRDRKRLVQSDGARAFQASGQRLALDEFEYERGHRLP